MVWSMTPLVIAAFQGHTSVVELLLKADGVDVNKAREDGATPLYCRSRRSRVRGRVTVES